MIPFPFPNRMQKVRFLRFRNLMMAHLIAAFIVAAGIVIWPVQPTYAATVSQTTVIDTNFKYINMATTFFHNLPPITLPAGVTNSDLISYKMVATMTGSDVVGFTIVDNSSNSCNTQNYTPPSDHTYGTGTGTFTPATGGIGGGCSTFFTTGRLSAGGTNFQLGIKRISGTQSYYFQSLKFVVTYDDSHETSNVALRASQNATAGSSTFFSLTWDHLAWQPRWLLFYPSGRGTGNCLVGCPTYVPINEDIPLGGSGSTASGTIAWTYAYNFSGNYTPSAILTRDCGPINVNTAYSSCSLSQTSTGVTVLGPTDADQSAGIELHFPPTGTSRVVNTPQPFSWRVNAATQCVGSSVSDKRIFAGYPPNANILDSGTSLSGTSGSGSYTFAHTSEELGGRFTPYIRVTCASGSGSTIYNGDTLYGARAQSLDIVSTTFNQYWTTGWNAGGKSIDYDLTTGSGAYFYTDVNDYSINQPVLMRYYYATSFTPSSIVVYPDKNNLPTVSYTLTGAYITNKTEHNYQFTYSAAGQYTPMIEVRSASYNPSTASTFRDIWLGGNQSRDPSQYLTVTSDTFGTGFFSFSNTDGIFGLNPATFAISFGSNASPFLQQVAAGLSKVIQAGLYVLNFIFGILKNSPIFNFFADILHPAEGTTGTFPSSLFGWPIAYRPYDTAYTVHYASPATGSKQLEYIIQAVMAAVVIRYVVKALV